MSTIGTMNGLELRQECERLEAQRDALLAAAKAVLQEDFLPSGVRRVLSQAIADCEKG